MAPKTLSADSAIADWLADPTGNAILTGMLAEAGQTPDVFKPVRRLAIKRLVKLSRGSFTQEMLDDLVARAAAGDVPAGVTPAPAPVDDLDETPAVPQREWTERIDGGRFTGQTLIITGAGSGIGRATASRVAREGGRVIAVDVSQERLDEFSHELDGADIVTIVADITGDAGVARIVEAAGTEIDGLANIAGIMDDMTPVGELTDAVWNRVTAVNVTGTMKLMRAVIPLMVARHVDPPLCRRAAPVATATTGAGRRERGGSTSERPSGVRRMPGSPPPRAAVRPRHPASASP